MTLNPEGDDNCATASRSCKAPGHACTERSENMKTQREEKEMIAPTLLRRFFVCASLVAAFGLAVFAGGASAAATTGTFGFQESFPPFADVNLCTGVTGVNTGAITVTGHFVDIGNGTQHVIETVTLDYRVDYSDGTYLISHSQSPAEFNTNAVGDAEFTFAQQDRGTLYSADGQVLGHQTVFTQGHVTWHDDFQTVISDPSQFRVTCS
jgi:hypothetical protein